VLIERLDEEEYGQGVWNDVFGKTPLDAPVESFNLITGATAATQDSSLKSFVDEDTATESRTLEKNENQVADLIWNILGTRSIPDRESIAKRLFELLQDVKEEETESVGMSIESLRSFYNFLQTHSNLKKPAIALTPVNDIYVSWKDELGSVFSIHFLSTGFVRFAIIAYSPCSDQPISLSGLVKAESLVKNVKPWGVLKWAGREGR
jgi:PHP family Zn ribbon phosphoesterase